MSEISLFELFREEVTQHAETLSNGLIAVESSSQEPKSLEPLMRAAHSLKGAARVVGLDTAVMLAHAMEDALVAAQQGRLSLEPERVDVLLRAVDWIVSLAAVDEPALPEWLLQQADSVDALSREIVQLGQIYDQSNADRPHPATPVAPPMSDAAAENAVPQETLATPEPDLPVSSSPRDMDREIRLRADIMTRLLSLTSEALVESHRLNRVSNGFSALQRRQERLRGLMEKLQEGLLERRSHAELLEISINLSSEFDHLTDLSAQNISELAGYAHRASLLAEQVFQQTMTSRQRRFDDGVQGLPRFVRDASRRAGKSVRFEIQGGDTLVDRDILERLEAPIRHLLQNAVDHGVESPDQRRLAGKDPQACVSLTAHHRDGALRIEVDDDGCGIDRDKLRRRIVEAGLTTSEVAPRLSERELFDFLFLPGISTRDEVSLTSGRGVGLDVVQTMVQAEGGSLFVGSEEGSGTRFSLRLPITRSVVRALLVAIAGEHYAFPLARIERTAFWAESDLMTVEGRSYGWIDGDRIALVSAAEILELPRTQAAGEGLPLVVLRDGDDLYAVEVDQFLGEGEFAVRALDSRFGEVPHVVATSLTEDGLPVLILDPEDLVRSIHAMLSGGRRLGQRAIPTSASDRTVRVLIVDDSITVRELERRLLQNHGYEVEVAVDGVEGWNALRLSRYDLLVTDIDMPRMNGIDLIKRVRADGRLHRLPILIVSYKDREEDRRRGLDAGADRYFTKSSFRDESLVHAVKDLLQEAASEVRTPTRAPI